MAAPTIGQAAPSRWFSDEAQALASLDVMGRLGRVSSWSALACMLTTVVAVATATTQPVIETASLPAVRLAPPARSFSLIATGDILTESPVNFNAALAAGPGERFDYAPLFAPITSMIASADISICHMEMPVGSPGERPGVYGRSPFGGNLILAPFEIAPGLQRAGFDRCSTASNHSYDLGASGIATTLAAIESAGMTHVGTARSPSESAVAIVTVNGVRLAHLAYTRYSNTVLPSEPWRVNFAATPAEVAADVNAARAAGAEVVVVSLHLSKEMSPVPALDDRQFVTDLTGRTRIDLIIEHGPHVIQPVERVNGTWVYWSVGNLISGMGIPSTGRYADPRTLDGLAAAARFTETTPGTFAVEPWPVLLCLEPFTRRVYAPIAALAGQLSPLIRSELAACLSRSTPVVPEVH